MDPLVEYKKECFRLFNELLNNIQRQVVYSIFKIAMINQVTPSLVEQRKNYQGAPETMQKGSAFGELSERKEQVVKKRGEYMGQKVGRNDPCPCGSGKKFKKCHGK
jgi:preprotein translocase subunit SecA